MKYTIFALRGSILFLLVFFSYSSLAQCPTGKVLVNNKGYLNGGSKLCPACVTKCIPENQLQKHLNSGWAQGPCVNYCTVYPPSAKSNQKKPAKKVELNVEQEMSTPAVVPEKKDE